MMGSHAVCKKKIHNRWGFQTVDMLPSEKPCGAGRKYRVTVFFIRWNSASKDKGKFVQINWLVSVWGQNWPLMA